MIPRRGLLAGLGALLAAPAIIRPPGLLMPVKPPPIVMGMDFGREAAGTLVFFSNPPGPEGGVFWQAWIDQAAKDVEFIAGINKATLGQTDGANTAVEVQARVALGVARVRIGGKG